jgi:hypothetical protein
MFASDTVTLRWGFWFNNKRGQMCGHAYLLWWWHDCGGAVGLPCEVTAFPCKYLGIPLSPKRLRHADEQPLVDSVAARIPTWKSGLLTNAGRLLLTKVVLSAIPVHLSIACYLSEWAIKQIDKRRRAFIWAGTKLCSGGKCKVAWPVVWRPLELGGLGLIDLHFFGYALRLRWKWLARTNQNSCWASLPSPRERMVDAMCDASLSVVVGDGANTLFWTDNWSSVGPLSQGDVQNWSQTGLARCSARSTLG